MSARPYEIPAPELPPGMEIGAAFKKHFEAEAACQRVPLREATVIYRDLVNHQLWQLNSKLMIERLRQRKPESDSFFDHLPEYHHLIRALFDHSHPLHDCVRNAERVVYEKLPQA